MLSLFFVFVFVLVLKMNFPDCERVTMTFKKEKKEAGKINSTYVPQKFLGKSANKQRNYTKGPKEKQLREKKFQRRRGKREILIFYCHPDRYLDQRY